jgi:hypothetical protein
MSYAKTPIQIPIAQQSPELIDLGYFRPSVTVTGIIDTIGGDTNNTTAAVAGMESFLYTRTSVNSSQFADGGHASAQRYYVPYKNALEEAAATWMYLGDTPLQIEIGDAQYPLASYGGYAPGGNVTNRFSTTNQQATGGAIYEVAIQQCRFSLKAATEDRYEFTMQFVAKARLDMPVSA